MNARRCRRRCVVRAGWLALAVATACGPVAAATAQWTCSGMRNFSDSACWLNSSTPKNGDDVFVLPGFGGPGSVLFPGAQAATLNLNYLQVDGGAAANPMSLVIGSGGSGGTLGATNAVIGAGAAGSLGITSGTFSATQLTLGRDASGSGRLDLSGAAASLTAQTMVVGQQGPAFATQSGGTSTFSTFTIGSNGSYSLLGGTLRVSNSWNNQGEFMVQGNGALRVAGSGLTNSGRFVANSGATLDAVVNNTGGFLGPSTGAVFTSQIFNNQSRGDLLMRGGTMSASTGAGFRNSSGASIRGSGRVANLGGNFGAISAVGGTLELTASGPVLNYGAMGVENGARLKSGATIENWSSGVISGKGVIDAAVVNRAQVIVGDQSTLRFARGLVNEPGGIITLQGSNTGTGPQAFLPASSITNRGLLQGAGYVNGPFDNQGSVRVASGKDLAFREKFFASMLSEQRADGRLFFFGAAAFAPGAQITGGGEAHFTQRVDVGGANAAGRLTTQGSVFLGGAQYMADIFGTTAGSTYDQLVVGGKLTLIANPALKLNSGSFIAQAGQVFNLFDWGAGGLSGTFASIDSSALQLAPGALLDTSRLYVDGTLAVVAVPEPATWALAIAGILGLLARRRLGRPPAPGRRCNRQNLLAPATLCAIAIALAQAATPAAAADRFWTCPPNDFTNPVCWSNPGPVLATDNLLIQPNGSIPVEVNFPGTAAANTTQTVRDLTIKGKVGATSPTFNVNSGSLNFRNLSVGQGDYGSLVVQQGGQMSGLNTQIWDFGWYFLSAGTSTSRDLLTNSGRLYLSGTGFAIADELWNIGIVQIQGSNAGIETNRILNAGSIKLIDAAWSPPGSYVYNRAGGEFIGRNSNAPTIVENKGLIQAERGLLKLGEYKFELANSGEIRVEKAATLSIPSGLLNEARGVVDLKGVDTGSGPQATLSNGNDIGTLINFGKLQGAGVVAMPVNHRVGGSVNVGAGSMLTFNRSFTSDAGSAMASDGVLNFAGPASFHNGALISGTGAAWFNHTVHIGAAGTAGRMTVSGSAFLGSTYNADILGTLAGVGFDQLVVGGKLGFGEASVLKLNSGSFIAQAGQSFRLFDWGVLSGSFGAVDASGLRLADGAALDLSRLYVDGTLAVVAVPEPATWALALAGVAGLLVRRRLGRQAQGQV